MIAQLIRKHKALKRRRLKYVEEDAAFAAARSTASGTEPTTDDHIDVSIEPVNITDEPVEIEEWPVGVADEPIGVSR